MTANIQSSRAQQSFGQLLDRALVEGAVVVERYGAPRVAIVEYGRYQRLLEVERELLRTRLREASAAASARAAHLSEAEIEALIESARAEVQDEVPHG